MYKWYKPQSRVWKNNCFLRNCMQPVPRLHCHSERQRWRKEESCRTMVKDVRCWNEAWIR